MSLNLWGTQSCQPTPTKQISSPVDSCLYSIHPVGGGQRRCSRSISAQNSTHHPPNNYLTPNTSSAGTETRRCFNQDHLSIVLNIAVGIMYSFVLYLLSLFMIIKLIHVCNNLKVFDLESRRFLKFQLSNNHY